MTGWNFDIDNMPREPGTKLWIAHPTDGKVYLTYRTHGTKRHPEGWWSGWMPGVEPVAYQLFVKPEHPFADRTAAVSELSAILGTVPGADILTPGDVVTMSTGLSQRLGFEPDAQFLINDVGGE
jgi:hypothetical protein